MQLAAMPRLMNDFDLIFHYQQAQQVRYRN
jgi:hypothetical protein